MPLRHLYPQVERRGAGDGVQFPRRSAGGTLTDPGRPRIDSALVKALARAFRWRKLLETGVYGTVAELAAAEKISESYVGRVLRLTLLAPDWVEAILAGRQQEGVTLSGLMQGVDEVWEEQAKS